MCLSLRSLLFLFVFFVAVSSASFVSNLSDGHVLIVKHAMHSGAVGDVSTGLIPGVLAYNGSGAADNTTAYWGHVRVNNFANFTVPPYFMNNVTAFIADMLVQDESDLPKIYLYVVGVFMAMALLLTRAV